MVKKDRIYKYEFDKIIKRTLGITSKERAYLDEVFAGNLSGGLTVAGLKIKIEELRYSKENIVSQHRLGKIKENIIDSLTQEDKTVEDKNKTTH